MPRWVIKSLASVFVCMAVAAITTKWVHANGCDWVITGYYWDDNTQNWEPIWEYQCWEDPPPPDPPPDPPPPDPPPPDPPPPDPPPSCSYSVNPGGATVGPESGTLYFEIATADGCAWSASGGSNFLYLTGSSGGVGPGWVSYGVENYTAYDEPRYAELGIAGQSVWVTQNPQTAPPPPPPPPPPSPPPYTLSVTISFDSWLSGDGLTRYFRASAIDYSWGCNHVDYSINLAVNGPSSGFVSGPGLSISLALGEYEGSYDISSTVRLFCDCVLDYLSAASSQVFTPTPPTITGPRELWSFGGVSPSGYATSITLTSSGGVQTQWSIVAGAGKVYLGATAGGSTVVRALDSALSYPRDDVRVRARVGQLSSEHTLTVLAPYSLRPDGGELTCPAGGFQTVLFYLVLDQFGQPLPAGVPANEHFTTGVTPDYPGTTWGQNGLEERGDVFPTARISDIISHQDISGPIVPQTVCDPFSTTRVIHIGQEIRVGSATPGVGALVQTDTLQFLVGRGEHRDIQSPP